MNLCILRIKILLENRMFLLVSLILPFVFFHFIGTIYYNSEEYSKIPIVVIDEDETVYSQEIINNVKSNELIRCIEASKEEAFDLLYDNKIEAIYIFNEGLEEKILEDDTDEIIEIHYLEESLVAPVLGDIIAGEILPILGNVKAANNVMYIHKKYEISDYEDAYKNSIKYSKSLWEKEEFTLPVILDTVIPDSKEDTGYSIDKDILAKRAALGMGLVFTCIFLIFCSTAIIKEKGANVYKRLKVSGYSILQLAAGNLLGILFVGILLFMVQLTTIVKYFDVNDIKSILSIILVYCAFTFSISGLILIFTSIFRNQTVLQSFAPLFVIVMGILGGCFWSIEFFPKILQTIAKITPTFWTLDALTKIMIFGLPLTQIRENILVLFIIGIILFLLNYVYNAFAQGRFVKYIAIFSFKDEYQ